MNAAAVAETEVDCRKACPEEYNTADAHPRDLVVLGVVAAVAWARGWTLNFGLVATLAVAVN